VLAVIALVVVAAAIVFGSSGASIFRTGSAQL
jgi:hypothetical protein